MAEILEDRTLLSGTSAEQFGAYVSPELTTDAADDEDLVQFSTAEPESPLPAYEWVEEPGLTSLLPVAESEPGSSGGQNDSIGTAEFVTNFGTGSLDDPAANISGSLRGDRDYFSFELTAGDVIGAAVTGAAGRLQIFNSDGTELIGSRQNATSIYPAASPLPGSGARVALSYVAPTSGTYTLAVSQGFGSYQTQLRVFRPGLEQQPAGSVQTFFLDFDGAAINPSIFGGPNTNRTLSPLSSFLSGWGVSFADQDAVIDAIIGEFERSFSTDIRQNGNNGDFDATGINGQFDVEILNSRDDADPFGDPNVSRIIVGGSQGQLGIPTIGISESIDVGNFDTTETSVVLLDLLSASRFNPNSLNRFNRAPGVDIIDLIGVGVGNIAAHEAGHLAGTWHTNQFNSAPNIMDQGGNLPGLVGIGPDNIFGTPDDVEVTFGVDAFVGNEGFTGSQDTRNAIAFGLSTGNDGLVPGEEETDPEFPLPLNAIDPLGSLAYEGSVSSDIRTTDDTDEYEVEIDDGQTITLVVESADALQARIDLFDPNGTLVATATAAAAGEDAVLQTVPTSGAGTYRVVVSGANAPASLAAFSDSQTQTGNVFSPNVLNFDFTSATPPGGDAMLMLDAVADLDGSSEFLTIDAEGIFSQDVFVTGGRQQQPVSTTVVISEADIAALAADGTISFTVTPSSGVNNLPGTESLTLTLNYADQRLGTGEYTLSLLLNAAVEDETHGGTANDTTATAQDLEGGFTGLIGDADRAAVVGQVGDPGQPAQPGSLGRLFAYDASANLIREFDRQTGQLLNSFSSPVLETFALNFGLATTPTSLLVGGRGSGGSSIYELDPDDGSVIRTITNPNVQVSGMAFLNGEIFLLTDSPTGRITVLDYATGAVNRVLNGTRAVEAIAASEDQLFATGESTLFEIDVQTGASTSRGFLSGAGFVEGLGIIGDELYAASSFNVVRVYDLNTRALQRTLQGQGIFNLEAIGADGGFPAPATPGTPGDPADVFSLNLEAGQRATVALESLTESGDFSESQTQSGAVTFPDVLTFAFDGAALPAGDGTLVIDALADISHFSEFFTIDAEGVFSVRVFDSGNVSDLQPRQESITISAAQLAELAADGTITFTVTPNQGVNIPNGNSFVTLGLSYPSSPEFNLEILDAAGTVLATGEAGAANVDRSVENFQAPADGTYFVRVAGAQPFDYSLVVTRGATFELDTEPPVSETGTELLVNGDFEAGNFSGWTLSGAGGGSWTINNGAVDPPGPGARLDPIGGHLDAIATPLGPGFLSMSQSFMIPEGVESATLQWSDRIRNFASGFQDPNQEFRVLLRDDDGHLIQEIFSTDPGDPAQQIGPNARSFDLTSLLQTLGGQRVELVFEMQDNLFFFNVTLDDISLRADFPPPEAVTFDFEEFDPQKVTSLIATRDGVSITITHENGIPFDVERLGTNVPAYNAQFERNSFSAMNGLNGVRNPGAFVVDFSQAMSAVSVDMGDFGQDSDNLQLIAYSGPGGTGTILDQATGVLPSGPQVFGFETLSVAAEGIRSVTVIGGNPTFPNSVFYDNITATTVPVVVEPVGPQNIDPTNQVLGHLGASEIALEEQTITFDELPPQRIDGVTIGDVTFDFKVNGFDSNDATFGLNPGPGATNNVNPPVVEGNAAGILTMDFAQEVVALDFGFALNALGNLSSAIVVDLFDESGTLVDSITVSSSLDPTFTGGQFSYSGEAISRAVLDFNNAAPRFTVDNIEYTTAIEVSASDEDTYEITLAAGETVQITTATTAGGPGEFVNELDPVVELIDPNGNVVATDDNGATDGRNIFLPFTAALAGAYQVRVRSAGSEGGEYVLDVNRAPVIGDGDLALSSAVIQEGDTVTLTGSFTDAGSRTHTVLVDWGDGTTTPATIDQDANTFTATRRFLDDGESGTPSDDYSIVVTVSDDRGLSDSARATLTVENVAPTVTGLSLDSATIDENGTVTLSGTVDDPGLLDTHTVQITWGDGQSSTIALTGGERTFSVTHQHLDDGPSPGNGTPSDVYTIAVSATDDDTGTGSAQTTVTVANVAPELADVSSSATPADLAAEGEGVTVAGLFTDVGTLDAHTVSIDWGDGSVTTAAVTESGGSGSFTAEHPYEFGGVHTIIVTVTDDDTGSRSFTTTAFVTGAGVQTVDGEQVLYIIGTSGDDQVTVNQQGNGQLRVHASFIDEPADRRFESADLDRIVVALFEGDDHLNVAGNIDLPTLIDAGAGSDHVNGGGGSNVILGGDGDDDLNGGSGRDILIGGGGSDRLGGGPGSDLLFGGNFTSAAGSTSLLDVEGDLRAIQAAWTSLPDADAAELRDEVLKDFNDLFDRLDDDGSADDLTGSSDSDWFLLFGGDVAKGLNPKKSADLVTDLS